jgi:hypothetical protein
MVVLAQVALQTRVVVVVLAVESALVALAVLVIVALPIGVNYGKTLCIY